MRYLGTQSNRGQEFGQSSNGLFSLGLCSYDWQVSAGLWPPLGTTDHGWHLMLVTAGLSITLYTYDLQRRATPG